MLHTSAEIRSLIERALAEDQASADATTTALIPPTIVGSAAIVAHAPGVLAGIEVAMAVFQAVDSTLSCTTLTEDGASIAPGDPLARVHGCISSILRAERTALNFVQRMSGIATETARYVQAVEGLPVRVVDTRKTPPGLRHLDKYAVRVGGGHSHRMNLADGVLIKDNHLAALKARGLTLRDVVQRARQQAPHTVRIEVEVETVEQAQEALDAGVEILMLDNMSLADMKEAVALARGRALTEASGGISLEAVRAVAETGVDIISVGALTHSARALDIGLEMERSGSSGS